VITCWKDLSKDYDIKYDFRQKIDGGRFPKKHHLGPQKSSKSLGSEKLIKIVNCATIKKTKKLKEAMVGVQVELEGGHQYPPGSVAPKKNLTTQIKRVGQHSPSKDNVVDI